MAGDARQPGPEWSVDGELDPLGHHAGEAPELGRGSVRHHRPGTRRQAGDGANGCRGTGGVPAKA